MFERTKNSKNKVESIKPGDEKLFENHPKYLELMSIAEKNVIGRELEQYLKERELLHILQRAGSVDNTQDPIKYRRVIEAIYQFCLINHISLDDPPIETASLKIK